MTVSDFLFSFSPYQLAHSYVYRPLFKLLIHNGDVSASKDMPEMSSQGASIKPARHFGDWPNLGAVSGPHSQGILLICRSLRPF
jgi:hypothetical protein